MVFHHLGLIDESLDKALEHFGVLNGPVLEVVIDEEQQNRIYIFEGFGNVRFVELLIPLSTESTITRYLMRSGPGLHHFAREVSSLEETREQITNSPGHVVVATFRLEVNSFGGSISTLFVSHNGLLIEYLEVMN